MSLKNPLRALLYSIFLASPNLPEAEIIIPKYLYLIIHSISCPIALYGNEIWGILKMSEKQKKSEIYDIYKDWECEKLNIKFCKYILGVNKKDH
jgi:hypothetical protein